MIDHAPICQRCGEPVTNATTLNVWLHIHGGRPKVWHGGCWPKPNAVLMPTKEADRD